jgi:Uma2 family endonuclease
MSAQPNVERRLSPQEYLARERQAETKSEYIGGDVLAMAGGSPNHSRIASDVRRHLGNRLSNGPCEVFDSDLRVRVRQPGPYFYPDVSVVCGEATDDEDCLTNPAVLIEVLSPTTAGYDRGEKWVHYRQMESLEQYVLIAQTEPLVEHYVRLESGMWRFEELRGLERTLALPALGCDVPLAEVYRRVTFGPAEG